MFVDYILLCKDQLSLCVEKTTASRCAASIQFWWPLAAVRFIMRTIRMSCNVISGAFRTQEL